MRILFVLLMISCVEPYDECELLREEYLRSRLKWSNLRDRYVDLDTLDDRTKELKQLYEQCQGLK